MPNGRVVAMRTLPGPHQTPGGADVPPLRYRARVCPNAVWLSRSP